MRPLYATLTAERGSFRGHHASREKRSTARTPGFTKEEIMKTLIMEWRHTYRSARRDGFGHVPAARMFAREVLAGWRLSLGLHPRYDRNGLTRRR